MFRVFKLSFGVITRLFCKRDHLLLENLVLRQQLSVLKRKHGRPKLTRLDRWFWVAVSRLWPEWKSSLLLVKPETVVQWHRRGFRYYWRLKSRTKQAGRTPITPELQQLIFRIASENPTWGAPRIHGELLMLGFDLGERTISRWLQRRPRKPDPARRWLAFLRNHREAIAAMDFFTIPTITFHVLYCFFVVAHDRRRILHFNVTAHPTSAWIIQQLREGFPYDARTKYVLLDHDGKYGLDVPGAIRAMGIAPLHTALRSPWQNGVAERWIGSCRRELLDHVIPVNERHLRRLLSDYVHYYHDDRTHLALGKGTPNKRTRATGIRDVISFPRLDDLHHRYERAA